MFQYIPKSMWFPTSVDLKQAATIEELEKLCKEGEVERVVIPMTYYGYGASLIDDSNRRSIKRHYRANRFKSYGYALTMSAYQFLKHFEFRELVEELQEQHPVFDTQDYSNLETETKESAFDDWVASDIDSELSPDQLRDVLNYFGSDVCELVEIDSDGATPYVSKENIDLWKETIAGMMENK